MDQVQREPEAESEPEPELRTALALALAVAQAQALVRNSWNQSYVQPQTRTLVLEMIILQFYSRLVAASLPLQDV